MHRSPTPKLTAFRQAFPGIQLLTIGEFIAIDPFGIKGRNIKHEWDDKDSEDYIFISRKDLKRKNRRAARWCYY